MSDSPQGALSNAERKVLKLLWAHKALLVGDVMALVREMGQEWTRSTVNSLLHRLEDKCYIVANKSKFAFTYQPLVSCEDVMHIQMMKIAKDFSDGDGFPLILAFAKCYKFSPEELARLQCIIDELKRQTT